MVVVPVVVDFQTQVPSEPPVLHDAYVLYDEQVLYGIHLVPSLMHDESPSEQTELDVPFYISSQVLSLHEAAVVPF